MANKSESATSREQEDRSELTVKIINDAEVLEIIKNERVSIPSSEKIQPNNLANETTDKNQKCDNIINATGSETFNCIQGSTLQQNDATISIDADNIAELLKETEAKLRNEYDLILMKEITSLRERFDYMLQNEQIRASYMLREAHRERQEKIRALESQLECKNLAGLMYVMCTERTRSRLEKHQLIEEYTGYIRGLQELLIEGQQLILSLSRGYKTAARVDNEWRTKMRKVVKEFMNFIYHYAEGPPETNQYFIDLPKLLKTKAPIEDDPKEDPCESDDEIGEEESVLKNQEKTWWERLEGEERPFVVFGDMCDFIPPLRRQVLKNVKAAKTAPKAWKEYLFNDIPLKAACENTDEIKDVYPNYRPVSFINNFEFSEVPDVKNAYSRMSLASRRHTGVSVDIRGGDMFAMGSILKIITSANTGNQNHSKTTLLAARDSMELTSTTKMRHLNHEHENQTTKEYFKDVFKLDIAKRHATNFSELIEQETQAAKTRAPFQDISRIKSEQDTDEAFETVLGSRHNDSLQVIPTHKPDKDHKINYERICPMEKCQRLQVDSFMRSLPPYMRANPFTHFQQTFEAYETCTPEQLEMLKQRLEAKKPKMAEDNFSYQECSVDEWCGGVATQTSAPSMPLPCTCGQYNTPVDSNFVFDVHDLLPVKLTIDAIQKECLHDDRINFDRFKIVGRESETHIQETQEQDFKQHRSAEITKILKEHPSLLDIFQANAH